MPWGFCFFKGLVKPMLEQLVIGGQTISYLVTYKKVKHINLRIRPDGTVSVSAPRHISRELIRTLLLQRQEALLAALARAQKRPAYLTPPAAYHTGDSFYLGGHPYTVRLVPPTDPLCAVQDHNSHMLYLPAPAGVTELPYRSPSVEQIKKDFLLPRLEGFLTAASNGFLERFAVTPTGIHWHDTKSRWGSCQPSTGRIHFSTRLAHVPISAAEAVVVHELAHLVVPNHSKEFYAVIAQVLPDYPQRMALLK